jgi:hypothetical protein
MHEQTLQDSIQTIGVYIENNPPIQNNKVIIPEFEIYSNPTISLDEIKNRRFSLMDRYR